MVSPGLGVGPLSNSPHANRSKVTRRLTLIEEKTAGENGKSGIPVMFPKLGKDRMQEDSIISINNDAKTKNQVQLNNLSSS